MVKWCKSVFPSYPNAIAPRISASAAVPKSPPSGMPACSHSMYARTAMTSSSTGVASAFACGMTSVAMGVEWPTLMTLLSPPSQFPSTTNLNSTFLPAGSVTSATPLLSFKALLTSQFPSSGQSPTTRQSPLVRVVNCTTVAAALSTDRVDTLRVKCVRKVARKFT